MAIHEPPCREWQAHLAAELDAETVEFRLSDFLDRFDREREAEIAALTADWAPGELQEAFGA